MSFRFNFSGSATTDDVNSTLTEKSQSEEEQTTLIRCEFINLADISIKVCCVFIAYFW